MAETAFPRVMVEGGRSGRPSRGPPGVPGLPLIPGRLPGLSGGEPPNTSVRYSHVAYTSDQPETNRNQKCAHSERQSKTYTQTIEKGHRKIVGRLTSRRWVGGPWVGVSDPGRAPK